MKAKLIKIGKWTGGILLGVFLFVAILIFAFQDKIIEKSIAEINKNLEVPMTVTDVEFAFWSSFPNISIDLLDVEITSKNTDKSLLKSKKFNLRFNPLDLLVGDYNLKQINVSNGELNLYVDSLGNDNYNIIKEAEGEDESDFKLELQSVKLKSMKVNYQNDVTNQKYRSLFDLVELSGELSEEKFDMLTSGKIQLISAKSSDITLVKNQEINFNLNLNVDQKKSITRLDKAEILIGGLPFSIDARVDTDSLQMHISSKDIQLTDAVEKISIDPGNELQKLNGKGTLDFDLNITGGMGAADPIDIACEFSIKDGQIIETSENLKFENIQLQGHYAKKDSTLEELVLKKVSFDSETGPFSGTLSINDFERPKIKGTAKGSINLRSAHRVFHFSDFDQMHGKLNLFCDFEAVQAEKDADIQLKKCSGDISIVNSNFKLENDKRNFKEVNGKLKFTTRQVRVKDFALKVNDSDMKLKGTFSNVFNYIYNKGTLSVDLKLSGDKIKLDDLGSTTKEEKIADGEIYALPSDLKGKIGISVGSLSYEGHTFERLRGQMKIQDREINFTSFSLENSGARVKGNLSIEEKSPEEFELKTNLSSNRIDVKKAFKEWNNFYQDVILADNISGTADLSMQLRAMFNFGKGIDYPSLDSKLNLKISNGQLKNAEIMKDIAEGIKDSPAKLALGKKNLKLLEERLKDISFSTLKNEISIKNEVVTIPRMNISSSALNMNVSGTHAFSNQVDYRFDFKFRDLLSSERDSEFGEIIDDGSGFRMFLKMTGDIYDPVLEWDREQQKQSAKEYRQEEKKQIKEMLKTEFGVFKNDTTVEEFKVEEQPKEEIKINWNPTTGADTIPTKEELESEKKESPKKKESKFKKALEKLKEQQQKDQEEEEEKVIIGIKGEEED